MMSVCAGRRLLTCMGLVAVLGLWSSGCSSDAGKSSSPTPQAESVTAPAPVRTVQPTLSAAPSGGCEGMDVVLSQAIRDTAQGQAWMSAFKSGQGSQKEWAAFVAVLESSYRTQLAEAAGDDATAREALEAVDSYAVSAGKILSGEVAQFEDEREAQIAMGSGQEPQMNPEYVELSNQMADSQVTASTCMPSWPVVF